MIFQFNLTILLLLLIFIVQNVNTFTVSNNKVQNIRLDHNRGYLPLRIMTFNIWNGGVNVEDGVYKISKHIKIIDPDIVALQEVEPKTFDVLLQKLGGTYTGVVGNKYYPDVGIITKHQIIKDTYENTVDNAAVGIQIQLYAGELINFWSLHLEYRLYGPYAANNKMVTSKSQILQYENRRVNNILTLLSNNKFRQNVLNSDNIPLIVCGDFNSPSHLDWIDTTKHSHGNWSIEWPATKLLQKSTGLIDTFREIHPDPLTTPANSWSTVQMYSGADWNYTILEPQDRVDFIFRKGEMLKPLDSFLYGGTEKLNPEPNHKYNDYPSDHYAVVTDFAMSLQ